MKHRRPGFMLIVALFVIGAIGLAMFLLGRHFTGLTQSACGMAVEVRAAVLLASGQAWAATHADQCAALSSGAAISLPVADLLPPDVTAELRIQRNGAERTITATVRQGRQAATYRATQSTASP